MSRAQQLSLALLAAQYVIIQLLTGLEYGDAWRNMHWGLLVAEEPRFLTDALDPYARTFGFQPEPPSLAPLGLYSRPSGPLHGLWGPLAPSLFALLWRLTQSYLALRLLIPLVGAGAVLLTYRLARGFLAPNAALIAAAFLACFPLFREHAVIAYIEPLSALLLTAAMTAFLRGQRVAAIVFGALTMLCKADMLPVFLGVVCVSGLDSALRERRWRPFLEPASLAVLATVCVSPWILFHYLSNQAPRPVGETWLFGFMDTLRDFVQLMFYGPWPVGLLLLALISYVVILGARALERRTAVVLVSWTLLELAILLVFGAAPGTGNSPRVVIPGLPAVATLFAAGQLRLAPTFRRRVVIYLGALFIAIGVSLIAYRGAEAAAARRYREVWEHLRTAPRGFVLTERFWEATLYSRQPVTWFEFDARFEHNILHDANNFARYVNANPIRYVVLPENGELASASVRAYLDGHALRRERIAGIWLYHLQPWPRARAQLNPWMPHACAKRS